MTPALLHALPSNLPAMVEHQGLDDETLTLPSLHSMFLPNLHTLTLTDDKQPIEPKASFWMLTHLQMCNMQGLGLGLRPEGCMGTGGCLRVSVVV